MKTRKEIKNWLLENCVDEEGNLDLEGLDFSDFNGDVILNNLKVKMDLKQKNQKIEGNLWQNNQIVKGVLMQENQLVEGDLYQYRQIVKRNLYQHNQTVEGEFITQTLADDEEYKIENDITYIVKKKEK